MTNKEAIMVLKNEQPHCGKKALFPEEKKYEAYDMAIKALEQEPCGDCISRQAVLDYLDKMPSELTTDGRRMVRRRTLEEYISDTLPSVTPQPKSGHWIAVTNGRGGHECSLCHEYASSYKDGDERLTKYCPSCGAKMKGDKE